MKKFLKTISMLLAVLLLLGSLTCFSVLNVSAADEDTEGEEEEDDGDISKIDYTTEVYKTPEEALALMTLYLENDNYAMYFNDFTAAFAVVNKATGQITFSNPYDVASSVGSVSTKQSILSQIIVRYVDNDTTKMMYSYKDAALNGQISIKKIKSGIRVEYIIGDEATRKLVPHRLSCEVFDELIKAPVEAAMGGTHNFDRFMTFFNPQRLSEQNSEKAKAALLAQFPICATMDIYVLDPTITPVEMNFCEEIIKGYCPDYTFDQMDQDHDATGYESTNEISPVFKMALEYTLNEDGFTVRLPSNGIRFNTSMYSVEYISILPYVGAGNSYNTGYTVYPDGSGALFCFEDLKGKSTFTTARKIYGTDFAYHTLDGTYQKALRYPVYGIKSDDSYFKYTVTSTVVGDESTETVVTEKRVSCTVIKTEEELIELLDKDVSDGIIDEYSEIEKIEEKNGYVAVIEEGESLCELATYHAGALSDYHTVMNNFNPRPKDSYDISDSISVTGSATQTIVSSRKYTGNLKIRYFMLSDDQVAKETGFDQNPNYYWADYVGMAQAYSDYLVKKGILERLTEDDVTSDIPLYVESFGTLEVTEQILSFPVDVMKPLTTFDDIITMYTELSEKGITNIDFKLTGFANGGMYANVPYKLKWEKSVGGKAGFRKLLEYATKVKEESNGEKNLGVFPEFDFLYVHNSSAFDGLRMKRDAIKTIDDRYTSKRYYSATRQTYLNYYDLALSPAYIERFSNKLLDNYTKYAQYGSLGISISTLGTDLNSDFDEDEPYNREDDKKFIGNVLAGIAGNENISSVMTDGANAYTWKYVDHILNVSLDSSRFMKASYSIPFIGLVLHGYIQFAGTPLNMEGDTNYATLKAIENGASMYFVLSYRNTNKLKEDYQLSKYYSVDYSIWKDDVVKYYERLNNVMNDVQTKPIIGHTFLSGIRVLDINEIETDIKDALEANNKYESEYGETSLLEKQMAIAEARAAAKKAVQTMKDTVEELTEIASGVPDSIDNLQAKVKNCKNTYTTWQFAVEHNQPETSIKVKLRAYNTAVNDLRRAAVTALQNGLDAQYTYEQVMKLYETASKAMLLLTEANAAEELIQAAQQNADEARTYLEEIRKQTELCKGNSDEIYEIASAYVDAELIDSYLDFHEDEEEEEEEEEEVSRYLSDNGNIVAVTYGGKDGNDMSAYKTFILNYNNYSVTVNYQINEETTMMYTIPAGEFVEIKY